MRLLTLLCLILLATIPVLACAWDSDTLAMEAKGLPDTVQIITGRFERNPPLYYQMRLKRVSQALKTQPGKLEFYDDAGVACDRLGRGAEAIDWMKRKRAQLGKLGFNKQSKEHWYRYHANLGTFLAHDWLRSGANRKNLVEMKQARDHIKRAIKINPNAHFGREKYQLSAMEWILNPDRAEKGVVGGLDGLPTFVEAEFEDNNEAARGISGLIVLGAAWESIDIFNALQAALSIRHAPVAYLASLRTRELAKEGKRSLYPGAPSGPKLVEVLNPPEGSVMIHAEQRPGIEKQYVKLRAEADEFQKRRTDYMMERLKAGRHPDTDTTFWKEWRDAGPPVIDDPLPPQERIQLYIVWAATTIVVAFVLLCGYIAWRFARKLSAPKAA